MTVRKFELITIFILPEIWHTYREQYTNGRVPKNVCSRNIETFNRS